MKTKWVYENNLHEHTSHCEISPKCAEVALASEVREEVEKARAEGMAQGSVLIHNTKEENDRIRAEERERIAERLKGWAGERRWDSKCIDELVAQTEPASSPQPVSLEKIPRESLFAPDDNELRLADAVNALVDRVNELAEEVKRSKPCT